MNNDMIIGGKWNILGKDYQGNITFNKENGTIVLSIYYKNKKEFIAWMNKPTEIDIITGKLNQEIKCTLTDCQIVKRQSNSFFRHHIVILAKIMFLNLSKNKKDLLKFNEVHFHIPNIIKWSKLSGFEYFDDKDYRLKIGYKFKDKVSIKINDNTSVEFVPYLGSFNFDMQVEKLDISQHIGVHIINKKETTFNVFLETFKIISDMITLATNSKINVVDIKGINYKKYNAVVDRKNYIKYEIITNLVKHDNARNLDAERTDNYLFNLNNIADKNRLKKWFDSYEKYSSIYNLYNLGINNDVPDEIRFCNLIQALELLHTKKYKKVKLFFNHIDSKFENNPSIIDLVKKNPDQSGKFIILKNRLIDLFINDFSLAETKNIVDNIDTITTILSDTRHYYTHYSGAKKSKSLSGTNLKYGIYILDYLLSCFILQNLEFDINEIKENRELQLYNIKSNKMVEKIIKNQ